MQTKHGEWWVQAVLVLALSACGNAAQVAAPPRPVLVVHPAPATQATALAYAGEIRAREEASLSFRVGGNLVRRLVDVGDQVSRGQLLAELDPTDLQLQVQAAQARLAAADGERSRAAADRARYASLAQQQLVSRSALDAQQAAYAAAAGQAKAARAQLDVARNQAGYAQLRAPRDGVIALREVEAGQVVAAGQTAFGLAARSGRDVVIALPETRIRQFTVGQRALVELWNAPAQRLPAHIREISPVADAQTRTYATRVALDGEGAAAVELGQSARVYFEAGADASARLSVPLAAVQRDDKVGAGVWVVNPATRKLHLARVELGAYGEDQVPVLRGVKATDWIVAAGGHLLREGEMVAPVDRQNRPLTTPIAPAP
ncbi:MAG: efflux RND transporter periplasmic adaptor subunit [Luteimonas sp.]